VEFTRNLRRTSPGRHRPGCDHHVGRFSCLRSAGYNGEASVILPSIKCSARAYRRSS
jgi:hypothetical protein